MAGTTRTLKMIAVCGGVISIGGAFYFSKGIQDNFKNQPYYRKSLEMFDGYSPGINILGKPIRLKDLDLGDLTKTWTDGYSARLAIPMKGSRTRGTLHSFASRSYPEESWTIDKLDLEVDGKIWTFYINPQSKHKVKPTDAMDPEESENYWKSFLVNADSVKDKRIEPDDSKDKYDTKFEYLNMSKGVDKKS